MSETKRCPRCQAEIPAGAPEGLCPQCLLKAGLEPKTAEAEPRTAAYSPSGSRFVPPPPAELQAAFPQLEILELLGKGGMGAVYKARQPGLDRLVAVKILPPEVSQDPAFAERFTREARALARLNHPNIVGVYDSGRAGGYYYFVMEYLDGVNLRQAMRAGDLKAAEALKIVPQICDALQFAHDEGIVHRDIKPENILLDKKGRVKIADFGLAKLLGKTAPDVSLTGTQQVMGTMHYMAPEQFEGSRDVDHRADIYSLGVTFYEMLTGELPIGRFAAPSKKVQIDVRLDEVVLRSLEKEPELRYQHASEIKTDMEGIVRTPVPATGEVADELEQLVLKYSQNKWQAIQAYRNKTRADLTTAKSAVEAIAQKLGIPFPPVTAWTHVRTAMTLVVILAIVGLWAWVYIGLSPVIAIPITLLLAAPSAVTAWKKWGTREGFQAAVWAGIILSTSVGIPVLTFLVDPEPTLNRLYALTGTTPGPHDALFVQGLFWIALLSLLFWLIWFLRKSMVERGAASVITPKKQQAPGSPAQQPEGGVQFQTLRYWAPIIAAMTLVIFAIFYLWALGPNMISLVLMMAAFAVGLAWKQRGAVASGPAVPRSLFEPTQPPKATPPKRPWGVPILGAFNVFVAVICLYGTAADVLFPDELPANLVADERLRQLYEIWRMGDAIGSYLAALACFVAGIGLMLWMPWARRLTVTAAVFLIAKFVLEIPAIVAFVIQPAFAEIPQAAGPDPNVQAVATLFLGILFAMLLLFPLICNLAVLIYLTRSRIIAAFGPLDVQPGPVAVDHIGSPPRFEVKTETIAPSNAEPKPDAVALEPSGPERRTGYLRLVVLPVGLLFALMVLIVALLFLIEAFIPFSPPGPPQDAQPQTIVVSIGFILMLLVFLVLNGVWIAKHPHAAKFVRGLLIAGWTALCFVLFLFFWIPAYTSWSPNPYANIDGQYWPYHGISESTVSLAPAAPIYRRLVIREEAEAKMQGCWRGDFVGVHYAGHRADMVKLTYKLELQALRPIDGQANFEMTVDALLSMGRASQGNKGVKRSGSVWDAEVIAEWLRDASTGDAKPEDIDAQARAIVGIMQHAAKNDMTGYSHLPHGRQPVCRLDMAVGFQQLLTRPLGKPFPFRTWNAAESVEIEPVVPILYVGVPLMLAVWGVGLWLLLRRRPVSKNVEHSPPVA